MLRLEDDAITARDMNFCDIFFFYDRAVLHQSRRTTVAITCPLCHKSLQQYAVLSFTLRAANFNRLFTPDK